VRGPVAVRAEGDARRGFRHLALDAGRSAFAAAYVQTAGGRFDLMPLKVTELATAQTMPERDQDQDHGRVSMTVEQSFAAVAVSFYDDGFAHGSFV
jgi:uncharacterized metal-binding protein